MYSTDYIEVAICGLGGQGVLVIGRTLAEAGAKIYKHATYFPNYSAAMRGGQSECTVILSQTEIPSPAVLEPQMAILMSQSAYDEYESRVKPNGLIILDSSLITKKPLRQDLNIIAIPASEKALEMGNSQVANFILLGAFLETTKALPLEIVEKTIEERLKGGRGEPLIELNKKALQEGTKLVRG